MSSRSLCLAFILSTFASFTYIPSLQAQEATELTSKQTIGLEDRIYGLSNFWKEAAYNFGHWDATENLDWDAAYQEFLPRVISAENDYEYYMELARFSALLKDGHTNIYMPRWLRTKYVGRIPLIARELGHRVIVDNVEISLAAQVPIGSEILEVDGRSVVDIVENDVIPFLSVSAPHMYWDLAVRSFSVYGKGVLLGKPNTMVTLTVETPDGAIRKVTTKFRKAGTKNAWQRQRTERSLSEFKWLENGIAYIALNSFADEKIVDAFVEKLPELLEATGIVVDIRKNGGGNSANSRKIAQYFTDNAFHGSAWRTPKHLGAYKAWGKYEKEDEGSDYRDYYYGHVYHTKEAPLYPPIEGPKLKVPTVVLAGRDTASAAEDFMVMADNIEHLTYVGEPTHGSTGQPLQIDNMPGGGSARISTKRDFYADGREFIGVGVLPDVEIRATIEDIRTGRDVVLEKALEILAEKLGKSKN